jgi:hypothetical protein
MQLFTSKIRVLITGGLDEIMEKSPLNLSAHPNPFSNNLELQFELTGNSDITLKIVDANGRVIHFQNEPNLSAGHHTIPVTITGAMPSGACFAIVSDGRTGSIIKLIRQ